MLQAHRFTRERMRGVTDAAGRQYGADELDQLLAFDPRPPT
jgi:hypothetical protein